MAQYLLIAHQTAECDELLDAACDLASEDGDAEFVLLVPATPICNLLVWEEGETREVARHHAVSARARLEARGLRVADARPGDQDPTAAVADELHDGRRYAAIVLSTLAPGLSRWLRMDVPSRLRRNFPHQRVIHVTARAPIAVASH
jgi:hypothetical protein